jgi:sugar lactone lactonase YvrE
MKRTPMLFALLAALVAAVTAAAAGSFPNVISLPTGFQPEGLAIGKRHTFYTGSTVTGVIYRGDLRTGMGAVLPQSGGTGRSATGIAADNRNRIFVAGGMTGQAYVYDARTGATLATYNLAPAGTPAGGTFVNDAVVTRKAVWFTDSRRAFLYRVPLGRGGALGAQGDVVQVPLSGDFQLAANFNLNGMDATRNGKALIAVQTNLGRLYRIDPATGAADVIELTGGDLQFGDGLLLRGRTAFVVQNQLNRVAVVRLSADLSSGTIVGYLTAPGLLDVPTSIDAHGGRLYVVNARFGTPNPQSASYTVVQLPKS